MRVKSSENAQRLFDGAERKSTKIYIIVASSTWLADFTMIASSVLDQIEFVAVDCPVFFQGLHLEPRLLCKEMLEKINSFAKGGMGDSFRNIRQ